MNSLLDVKNLTHSFSGLKAVDNFSTSITKSRIIGLIGPNGAGKTTVFNIITGFIKTEKGEIFFKKQDISKWATHKIARGFISRTFQDLRLITGLSVLENVLLSRPNQIGEAFLSAIFRGRKMLDEEKLNKEKACDILELLGLSDKQNDFAGDISYGEQKLLSLGCCLAADSELLLLDEPVSGLHPDMIEKVCILMRKIIQLGKTIVFIEHNIEVVKKVSDHVIVMDHGQKKAEGTPIEILNNQEILGTYLE